MSFAHNKQTLQHARHLRKNMTPEERHLWYDFLRNYPVKITKQKPIGNYIVDFYCASAHLVIEIDGSQHYKQSGVTADAIRTDYLESLGLKVVRYSNREISTQFTAVCESIHLLIQKRKSYP